MAHVGLRDRGDRPVLPRCRVRARGPRVRREISSDRARAKDLLADLEDPARLERSYPAPVFPSLAPPEYANTAWAPSMHMRGLTEHVERLEVEVANAFLQFKKMTDAALDGAAEAIRQDLAKRDAELAEGLRYVLAGSTRERVIGVGLLVVGIVLGTAGSVIGNI
jgi:hypothetical protein